MRVQDAVSAHPGLANLVTNVSYHSVNEIVYGGKLSGNGQRRMVGPEQKSNLLMNDIVCNFQAGSAGVRHICLDAFYSKWLPIARQAQEVRWM